MPEDLVRQIAPLHELVRAHGWPLLMVEGVEADDVIGTLATQAAAAGIDTLISSSDKDLTQLVRPGITMVNTMSNETYDDAGVRAKFDVRPDQVLDLLTLTGDAVDNVPGVAKVGPKTAAKWLAQYGSLDNVVAHAGEIGGVVGANLREALPWLPQGKRLLTVKTDCELPVHATDLVVTPVDAAALKPLYERFEFKSWLRDLGGDGERVADAAGAIAARAASGRRRPALGRATRRRARGRAARAFRNALRSGARRGRARALARGDRRRRADLVRHGDDEPRSDAGAHRRRLALGRAGTRVLHPARSSLCGRARPARPRDDARAARAVARGSGQAQGRPEPEVRRARARERRPRARRRRARHAAAVLRARVAQAARHGQPRVAPPRREDDHVRRRDGQGRQPHRLRPGRRRPRDRVRGRGRRHHAAPAPRAVPADRGGREARLRVRAARDARARGAVPHGAQRHPRRLGAARAPEPRAGRARRRIGTAGAPARRAAVQPGLARSSWARSCSRRWACRS